MKASSKTLLFTEDWRLSGLFDSRGIPALRYLEFSRSLRLGFTLGDKSFTAFSEMQSSRRRACLMAKKFYWALPVELRLSLTKLC